MNYYEGVVDNSIGLVTGTSAAINFSNREIHRVRFKGAIGNAEAVYLGTTSSNMWPLAAGSDTDWIPADNLSDFWYKGGTGTVNKLHVWTQ